MQAITKVATLGGGCFWCTDTIYRRIIGVTNVQPGYANGTTPNPTYKQVCTGSTGHAEVIQFHYDPNVVTFDNILRIFFNIHDPTTKDRQGEDIGTQYRSVILYSDEEQKAIAQQIIQEVNDSKQYANPIVTQIQKLDVFYPAEDYHHNYFNQNTDQGYCKAVIQPKLKKFLTKYNKYTDKQ